MNYLLDTHALLWIVTDDLQLSDKAKQIFLDSEKRLYLSMASVWELAIKSSLSKISLGMPLEEFINSHVRGIDIDILEIKLPHVLRIENLPFIHRDPFDRLIISQAIEDNLIIVGNDSLFDQYNVTRIW